MQRINCTSAEASQTKLPPLFHATSLPVARRSWSLRPRMRTQTLMTSADQWSLSWPPPAAVPPLGVPAPGDTLDGDEGVASQPATDVPVSPHGDRAVVNGRGSVLDSWTTLAAPRLLSLPSPTRPPGMAFASAACAQARTAGSASFSKPRGWFSIPGDHSSRPGSGEFATRPGNTPLHTPCKKSGEMDPAKRQLLYASSCGSSNASSDGAMPPKLTHHMIIEGLSDAGGASGPLTQAMGVEMFGRLAAKLEEAKREGVRLSLPVSRMVSLEPLLNTAANNDVEMTRCARVRVPSRQAFLGLTLDCLFAFQSLFGARSGSEHDRRGGMDATALCESLWLPRMRARAARASQDKRELS